MQFKVGVVAFVLIVSLGAGTGTGATLAFARAPSTVRESIPARKKPKPVVSAKDVKALAAELGLSVATLKKGLAHLKKGKATQIQSGPTALAPDQALRIKYYGDFATGDDRIFVIVLGAAPGASTVAYEYGLGVAIDGQPQSTPNPSAIAGFGKVALSRMWVGMPASEYMALNPAAQYSPVESGGSAIITGVYAVFRVPAAERGPGAYYLQSFGRDGEAADSPAGYSIVEGTLKG